MIKAISITEFGAPDVLKLVERPLPTITADEVLIRVKAAGVNRPDVIQRKGQYPAPEGVPADIPGLEVAGIIEAVGKDTTQWQKGDEVMALVAGGGYAEYIPVHHELCIRKPQGLTFIEAASLPETLYTVWSNVFERGALQKGESFLVHGGTSGIGITAIQLAKAIGADVYTTVGSDEKRDFCITLGATAINYKTADFSEHFNNIDVVLDMIGGEYFDKNIRIMNPEGRLVYINAMGGVKVELNLLRLMQKRITVTGSTLRTREHAYKAGLTARIFAKVIPIIESGAFKPIIDQVFPLSEANKAHALMESSQHIGKIILAID